MGAAASGVMMGIQMSYSTKTEDKTASGAKAAERRRDVAKAVVRAACVASSLMIVFLMRSSEPRARMALDCVSCTRKWCCSCDYLNYHIYLARAVLGHSLVQLLPRVGMMLKKELIVRSRAEIWILFVVDQ